MTLFANDKIRTSFYLPNVPGEAVGKFLNTNPEEAAKNGGKLFSDGLKKMNFIRSNSFRQQIYMKFKDEFNGLNVMAMLFHTEEQKNHTLYDNWNFTSSYYWDSLTN